MISQLSFNFIVRFLKHNLQKHKKLVDFLNCNKKLLLLNLLALRGVADDKKTICELSLSRALLSIIKKT